MSFHENLCMSFHNLAIPAIAVAIQVVSIIQIPWHKQVGFFPNLARFGNPREFFGSFSNLVRYFESMECLSSSS